MRSAREEEGGRSERKRGCTKIRKPITEAQTDGCGRGCNASGGKTERNTEWGWARRPPWGEGEKVVTEGCALGRQNISLCGAIFFYNPTPRRLFELASPPHRDIAELDATVQNCTALAPWFIVLKSKTIFFCFCFYVDNERSIDGVLGALGMRRLDLLL